MCMCMCVCVHTYMCSGVHVCVFRCVRVCKVYLCIMCVCLGVHLCLGLHCASVYVCLGMHMHVCLGVMYVCFLGVYVCIHVCICI